jgi:hypothetical protein
MDFAKPLRSLRPKPFGAHGDSKHTEPCLSWRCELYVRLSTIVKTKVGSFFLDKTIYLALKIIRKMDAIKLYLYYFS